jgi:hypothetical protein
LLVWGLVIAATGIAGAFVDRQKWVTYDWAALVIIASGLALVLAKIYSYARKRKTT